MDVLFYCGLGIFLIISIVPILQNITDLILALFQWMISAINVKIIRNNSKAQDLSEPVNTSAIGFQYPTEQEEEYEDDEDVNKNTKQRIGF